MSYRNKAIDVGAWMLENGHRAMLKVTGGRYPRTVIGMTPGLVLMSALGHQIWSIISEPTPANILLFVLAVLAWLTVSIGAQALLLHWRRRST